MQLSPVIQAHRRALHCFLGQHSYGIGAYDSAQNMPSAFTVEFWINPGLNYDSHNRFILQYQKTSNYGWNCYIFNKHLQWAVYDGTTFHVLQTSVDFTGGWHHYAGVFNSGTSSFYLNGALVSSVGSLTLPADPSTPQLRVFTSFDVGSPYAEAAIQDIRYSNVARYTAAFVPPSTPFVSDSNTLALYSCNESAGLLVHDGTSNANHLVLSSGSGFCPPWFGIGRP